ncbi:helix-turn-helix domain-containing protein [Paenibacillus sp. NPDC093718]
MKTIELRLAGVPVSNIMRRLGIRNRTQLKVWLKWYREVETFAWNNL